MRKLFAIVIGAVLIAACSDARSNEEKYPSTTQGFQGTITEPDDAVHNHDEMIYLEGANSFTVISRGSFGCRADQHRAVLVNRKFQSMVGCADFDVSTHKLHIQWEDGRTLDVNPDVPTAPGHTDGPSKEQPYHGGPVPDRNS